MDSTTSEELSTCGESLHASLGTEIDALQVSECEGSTGSRKGGLRPNPAPNWRLKDYVLRVTQKQHQSGPETTPGGS